MGGLRNLILLKLMSSQRKQRRDYQHLNTKITVKTPKKTQIKKEINGEFVCRVCLKNGYIPIFGNNGVGDISEEFSTFSNIQIKSDDTFPKYLCQACHSLLQGAIIFRKTAQASEENLRHPLSTNLNDEEDNIDNHDSNDYQNPDQQFSKPTKYFYKCINCDVSFATFKEYNDHRISPEHLNMRRLCPICNKSCSVLYFKKHVELHNKAPMFMCDVCGKEFTVKAQFEKHRAIHTFDLPFKCSLCPYRGRFKESLKGHMFTHTGEKPYQCTECPFRSVSKSNLNKHTVIHKKEYDFKCDSCGRGFYTKRNLEMHIKVDHNGIKEHICNICGKEFGYRKQMMRHQLKVHKREKLRSGRMPLYLQVESQEGIS